VFALGVILYEALAGRPPFAGQSLLEALTRLEAERFEPLRSARPDVPPWLAQVVERTLARDPAARFEDGAALARALAPPRRGRRLGPALLAGAGLLALGLALAVAAAPRPGQPERPEPTAPSSPSSAAELELEA